MTHQARRSSLRTLVSPETIAHPGLWWDKFVESAEVGAPKEKEENAESIKSQHIQSLENLEIPRGYQEAFERWETGLENNPHVLSVTAEAQSRTILGLGEKSLLEVGMRFHHTWGIPFIPGSALKGLAAATAHQLVETDGWKKETPTSTIGKYHKYLFGDTSQAGIISFMDAWWIPEGNKLPIYRDILTVHHQKYYSGESCEPEDHLDMDSPIPIPLASTKGNFLVAIRFCAERDPTKDKEWRNHWLDLTMDLLEVGLQELGIGAKTSSGYGRFKLQEKEERLKEAWDQRIQEKKRKANLSPEERWAEENEEFQALLTKNAEKQIAWLKRHASGNMVPQKFQKDPSVWKMLIKAKLQKAFQRLSEPCQGDPEKELKEKEKELNNLTLSPKGTEKQRNKRKRNKKTLEHKIKELKGQIKKAENRRSDHQNILDFFSTDQEPSS
jgi:CRISPR-associated protein Cmr6